MIPPTRTAPGVLSFAAAVATVLSALPATAATTAPNPPEGAGYVITQSQPSSGALTFTVPKVTCTPAFGTWIVDVYVGAAQRRGLAGSWGIDVKFGCAHGGPSYRSTLTYGSTVRSGSDDFPGGVATLSYTRTTQQLDIHGPKFDSGDGGGRPALTRTSSGIAYLVTWAGRVPAAISAVQYLPTANRAPLARLRPRPQLQRVGTRVVLVPRAAAAGRFTTVLKTG